MFGQHVSIAVSLQVEACLAHLTKVGQLGRVALVALFVVSPGVAVLGESLCTGQASSPAVLQGDQPQLHDITVCKIGGITT